MARKGSGHATGLGTSENEGPAWGKGKFANMPTDVEMKMYPKVRMSSDALDDTINEIDDVVSRSEGKRSKYVSNQH